MIVNECMNKIYSALQRMQDDHDRIQGSFRIEMESLRRRTKLTSNISSRQDFTTQPQNTVGKSKDSTMMTSRDPSNSLSPQILHYDTASSNQRVDTLNEIAQQGSEEQFSFEEIKLNAVNPLNNFKSPNPGWVTNSRQQESVSHFQFEPDCGSFQHHECSGDDGDE